jgi:membrane fusion protein, multidrug efflux system
MSNEHQQTTNEDLSKDNVKKKNKLKFYLPLLIVIMLILGGVYYWYREYTKYITTDDAYIDSDKVSVSPKIIGRIIELRADEGDSVKSGMLIAELDSADLISQKKQIMALKEQSVAGKAQSEAKYEYDKESIKVLEISFQKAREDYDRAKKQISGEVITQEQFDHMKNAFETSEAQLSAAKTQLNVSKALIGSANASIESAQAQIGVIETQLRNTRIYAPMDGIVAKRWLLKGDIVQPGQSILTITNTNKLWVLVYLEETKLSGIHVGQKASFTIDALKDVKFEGRIYQIGSNTASQFSLIPPNNASGNFTKVTQRIPLKISIDAVDNDKKLSDFKILAGMSVLMKILRDN